MGAAIGSVVQKVTKDYKIKDEGKQKEVEERMEQLYQLVKMKLKSFYDEMILQAVGEDSAIQVPISTVVDKIESIYATEMKDIHNALTTTIENSVGDLLGNNWKGAISGLIKGGLESFFGPSQISTSGMMSETKTYHVVWSNNAMLRLDAFVTKTSLQDMAGLNNSTQIFGGYILVVSVVDIVAIDKQVFMYELSKFQEKLSADDPDASKKLEDDITRTDHVLQVIMSMYQKSNILVQKSSDNTGKRKKLSYMAIEDDTDAPVPKRTRSQVDVPLQRTSEVYSNSISPYTKR